MSYLFELLHCEAGRNLKIILVISLLYIKNKLLNCYVIMFVSLFFSCANFYKL